ncbi:helix-turn-helix domain-containing protein [Roseospira navarrensis]|uniref:Helix-turn-helix domain-containing protein n=2 Tax=Roseospira navarrensis TaxID=140058 RepID=A0A7X2D3V5_9PROT|nr:helix-turn-helix domain-containing protein [Roseospira navarrensis]
MPTSKPETMPVRNWRQGVSACGAKTADKGGASTTCVLEASGMSESVLIDLEEKPSALCDSTAERLVGDGLIVCRCRFPPQQEAWISVRQTMLVRPAASVTVRWRGVEDQTETTARMTRQALHLIPPGSAIRIEWVGGDRALVLGLTAAFLDTHVAPEFDGRVPRLAPQATIRDAALAEMMSWFEAALDGSAAAGVRSLELAGITFGLRLFEVYGEEESAGGYATGGLGASRQRRIATFIDGNLDRRVSLNEMAGVVGLGSSHFRTVFRATFGQSPSRYLHERRIEKAKTLLLDPNRTIVDIALEVGYSSHGHFTTVFRKVTGTTPSRFRLDRL